MKMDRIAFRRKFLASTLSGIGIMAASLPALALVIDINTYVTGSTLTANATIATLTLTQEGSNVSFSFSNFVNKLPGGVGDDAYISELLFSYNGTTVLTNASFSNFGGSQSITGADFSINPSGKDAGYDFYLGLNYPTSSANRFTGSEFSTWTVSNASVDDFVGPVSGNGPASLAMVHVQQVGAGPGGNSSVKYVGSVGSSPAQLPDNPIPEPGSLALIGLGLLGLCTIRRRTKLQ